MKKADWERKEKIKHIAIQIIRVLVRLLYVFPINPKRVVFFSFCGEQYSCNPRAISEYLTKNYKNDYCVFWLFTNPENHKELETQGIKIVKYGSFRHVFLEVTAKYVINNTGAYSWIPVRKNQIHVNTWHAGGAYKRLQHDISADTNRRLTAKETTHMISSCRLFTKYNIQEQFGFGGRILEIGMPRNDVFFDRRTMQGKASEARKWMKMDSSIFIILYAPTWRYDGNIPCPDFEELCSAAEKRFGRKAIVAARSHSLYKGSFDNAVDVTKYPDMQDLLCAADMLITDYSSSIWDYSFTKRPCFLYVEDLDQYMNEQGFYTDIFKWGFPLCKSKQSLVDNILSYNEEEYCDIVSKHHQEFGSYENGHACETFAKEIFKRTGGH